MIYQLLICFLLSTNFTLSLNALAKNEHGDFNQNDSIENIDINTRSATFKRRIISQIEGYNSSLTLSLGCRCYQWMMKKRTAEISVHIEQRRKELNTLLDIINGNESHSEKINHIRRGLEEMNNRASFTCKGGRHFYQNVKLILDDWRKALKK